MIGLPHLLWSDGHPKISGFEAYGCDTKRLHMEVRCDHGSDWRIDFLACTVLEIQIRRMTARERLPREAETGEDDNGDRADDSCWSRL